MFTIPPSQRSSRGWCAVMRTAKESIGSGMDYIAKQMKQIEVISN